jgi:hypothetical protein
VSFWILQVSDVHYGSMSHWHQFEPDRAAAISFREIRDALADAKIAEKFDVVLLSGDFSWGPSFSDAAEYDRGFDTAAELAKLLLQEGWCIPKGLMVLPGNHDIQWSPKSGDTFHTREEAESRYRKFLEQIFPNQPERLRDDLGYYDIFRHEDRDYLFLTLNSCRIEARERGGTGYVGYGQIQNLLERVAKLPPRENRPYFSVAALHHHLLPIEAVRLKAMLGQTAPKVSFITDGIEILQALLQTGVSLALHGHLHMPFHYAYSEPAQNDSEPVSLVISCAGSFSVGAQSKNISGVHQFQAIEINEHFIRFHSFEAPLRSPGKVRKWQRRVIQFACPETVNRNWQTAFYLWQIDKRLRPEKVARSLNEFKLFEDCLEFDALRRGDSSVKERLHDAIEGEPDRLTRRAQEHFEQAFGYAISLATSAEGVAMFYQGFESDDPWYLEDFIIHFVNDWRE